MRQGVFIFAILIMLSSASTAQTQPEVFDVNVYRSIYPDIMNIFGSGNTAGAQNHWLTQGLPVEGRRASIIFDPVYYLQHNADLLAAYGPTGYSAALQHFITQGLPNEGRRGSLEFDVKYYKQLYSIGGTYLQAADDFLNSGLPIYGRRGSADFNVQDYISNYPDVAAAYSSTNYQQAALQWLRRGKAQGRHGFGALPLPTDCGDGHTTEFATVPVAPAAPALPQITVAHPAGEFVANGDVFYVNPPAGFGAQLTATTSPTPARGQYSVSGGVYTFNAADAESPVQINYTLIPIPAGYSRIVFNRRTDGLSGTGTLLDPFKASLLDVTLRHISEHDLAFPVPNAENGGGAPYGAQNLIVCLNDTGVFQTMGMYDWVINVGHTKTPPDGFVVNRNWHIHGKGISSTTLQLAMYLAPPPADWHFPAGTGLGIVISTHDDDVGGVEISDLTIDGNYPSIGGFIPINLAAIYLRGKVGGNNIHNVNVINYAGQAGGVDVGAEAFPVQIVAVGNPSPLISSNNQIKYVSVHNMAPPPSRCTGIAVANAQAEVAYNVVDSWSYSTNTFGQCNGFGGWDLDSSWFHDNFAFNNSPAGFLVDSLASRRVKVEFNQFINPELDGVVLGNHKDPSNTFAYYQFNYNNIQLSQPSSVGILFDGDVTDATVKHNNITFVGAPSGLKGTAFNLHAPVNTRNVFEYNQLSPTYTNDVPLFPSCVFNNWSDAGGPLANFPSTQSIPCSSPISSTQLVSSIDTVANSLEIYYMATDQRIHELWRGVPWVWNSVDVSSAAAAATPNTVSQFGAFPDSVSNSMDVFYLGSDQHVHQLWWAGGIWSNVDLTTAAAGPNASGNSLSSVVDTIGNAVEVYYLGSDLHVHELWRNASMTWFSADPTALAAAPLASAGTDLEALVDTQAGSLDVFYVASDQHIHTLWWSGGTWHQVDLTASAFAPNVGSGNVFSAVVDSVANTMEVYYLGTDQHIHELWRGAGFVWNHTDVTVTAAAPNAAGSALTAIVNPYANSLEVYYLAADQHVHQLWWAGSWHTNDVTAAASAPLCVAGSALSSIVDTPGGTMDIFYIGSDQHVHELWQSGGVWHQVDLSLASSAD